MTPEEYLKKLGVEGNAILHEYMEGYAQSQLSEANKKINSLTSELAAMELSDEDEISQYEKKLAEANKEVEKLTTLNWSLRQAERVKDSHIKEANKEIERLKKQIDESASISNDHVRELKDSHVKDLIDSNKAYSKLYNQHDRYIFFDPKKEGCLYRSNCKIPLSGCNACC